MEDLVERLSSFANWHVSCACGNVSDEAQTCIDAAKEIESLREDLRKERSAYMMAHGIFQSDRLLFRSVIEKCMKAAKEWDSPDYPVATRHAAADIEQQIRKFYDFDFPAFRAIIQSGEWKVIDENTPRKKTLLFWGETGRLSDDAMNWRMETGYIYPYDADGKEGWYWAGKCLREWDHKPTHWIPLPTPPTT
jgi:hypothetical protein